MKHSSRVVIIGSGVGGLATASILAQAGYQVQLFEQNEQFGGRMSVLTQDGFTFDMGPSWYLMPDIFEHFFTLLGERAEDHLVLKKLLPSYRVFFKDEGVIQDIVPDVEKAKQAFEGYEPGSAKKLERYLSIAKQAYEISKESFLYRNYSSILDFFSWKVVVQGVRLPLIRKMHSYVKSVFANPKLQKLLEYQLVFLGTSPYQAPALYTLMNYIDFHQGVFYPMGGMGQVTNTLVKLAEARGAILKTHAKVQEIMVEDGRTVGVRMQDGTIVEADIVISNAEPATTERFLLSRAEDRDHTEAYWNTRTLAPSALLLYIGVRGALPQLLHHNLLFCQDWKENFAQIFDKPEWPSDPSIYVSMTSATDPAVAPPNHENLVVLVPIAPGLEYTPKQQELYEKKILQTIAKNMDIPDLEERIVTKRSFCVKDFADRYQSTQGTALGLAHTISQTALFRPDNRSKKVQGLYYVGANTNPGIGVPMCLISAELVYKRLEGIEDEKALETL